MNDSKKSDQRGIHNQKNNDKGVANLDHLILQHLPPCISSVIGKEF
jgi:hypothetical protein